MKKPVETWFLSDAKHEVSWYKLFSQVIPKGRTEDIHPWATTNRNDSKKCIYRTKQPQPSNHTDNTSFMAFMQWAYS